MKSLILIVLLAALSVGNYAAVIQDDVVIQPEQDEIIVYDEIVIQDDAFSQNKALTRDDNSLTQDETVIQDIEDTSSDVDVTRSERLLLRNTYSASAIANTVRVLDVTARGSASLRITRVRATQIGANQGATARIISGGIGRNFVTVRIQSARGRGYNVRLEVWGR